MKRVINLLLLYLLWFKFFSIKPIGYLNSDIHFIIIIIYIIISIIILGNQKVNSKYATKKYYKDIIWIYIGIALSMLPAHIYYNQSIMQSVFTYRYQLLLLLVIVYLYKIYPSIAQLIQSINIFSILICIFFVIKLINPSLYINNYDITDKSELIIPGFNLITISIFYHLDKITKQFKIKDFVIIIILISILFLIQNRSILFPVTIMTAWTLLHIRSNYKSIIFVTIIILIPFIYLYTSDTWLNLIDETKSQLMDSDYNRNKSLEYFLQASPNILCIILGNGFLSSHTTSRMQDLMELGIYNSDLGFIGYWNQFGIIPIIVILSILLKVIFKPYSPYFLKLWALQILACGLTISYFGNPHQMIYFALLYYISLVSTKKS